MRLTDFPDVQGLPVRQKLDLVDELWVSMAPELDNLEASEPEQELLDEGRRQGRIAAPVQMIRILPSSR